MITNAVTQNATAIANDIRDIKPPVAIPNGWAWLWWTLAALVLLTLLLLAWRQFLKRVTRVAPGPPPIPAHVRAKQKLAEALALISQPKPFVIAVSDTARGYLEERFDFHAPERTTEEFLRELGETKLLLPEQKESLGEFLASCDLVKFAKYEPQEAELRGLHSSALKLVEETEPQGLPESAQPVMDNAIEAEPEATASNAAKPAKSEAHNSSKGKTLAIVGTLLQLGPSVWIISYFVMLFRVLILARNVSQQVNNNGIAEFTDLYSNMVSIYGNALILVCLGLLAGAVGLVLLVISLASSRYRSEWFFWFLVIYGFILLWPFFCISTPIGIFFIVYCLTKRREFFNQT